MDRFVKVMNINNKTIKEILDDIAAATGTKYKIEPHAIIFADASAPLDDMVIKVFKFDNTMLDALGSGSEPEAMKNQLSSMHKVPFPQGAKLMYDEKFRSLIVLNTPENLEILEDVLEELGKEKGEPLIQVQMKFVEINQSDLKELGFIHSISHVDSNQNGRLSFAQNDNVLRSLGDDDTFTFTRNSNGFNYDLVIKAINRSNATDILASPKVLTKSGEKVSIKSITQKYYEWEWSEMEVDTLTEGNHTVRAIKPMWPDFEQQDTGIEMDVTPSIHDLESGLIKVDVSPSVRELVGWTEYSYPTDDGQMETIKRPIFSVRQPVTKVTIKDGETIIVGGMIEDKTDTVDDKVPLLGDIPLIGNFFKSKSTTVEKTNLLIFVTVKLINYDGSPYFEGDGKGKSSAAGIGDIY